MGLTVVGYPGVDLDEIGDEAGDQAFQDAGVATEDEFVDYSGLVELLYH